MEGMSFAFFFFFFAETGRSLMAKSSGDSYLMEKSLLLQKGQLITRPLGGFLILTKQLVQRGCLQQVVLLMFGGNLKKQIGHSAVDSCNRALLLCSRNAFFSDFDSDLDEKEEVEFMVVSEVIICDDVCVVIVAVAFGDGGGAGGGSGLPS